MVLQKCIVLCFIFLVTSCANLANLIEPLKDPEVSLVSIEPIKGDTLLPRFILNLSVTNPNDRDLDIAGVNFSLAIEDRNVLSGIANNIPTLLAYSETPVSVTASVNLFDLIKLLSYFSKNTNSDIHYRLKTTIDPRGFIAFDIEKEGLLTESLLGGLKKGVKS